MATTREPQPADIWPRWLHFGCVGCSVVVAAGFVAAAIGLAVMVQHQVVGGEPGLLSGEPPLRSLDNGCLAVRRAAGFAAMHAGFLRDGRILALGYSAPDVGGVIGQMLSSQADPQKAAAGVLQSIFSRVLLINPATGQTQDLSPPQEGTTWADVEEIYPDAAQRKVAAVVTLMATQTIGSADSGPSPVEIWLLDLDTGKWRRWLPLGSGRSFYVLRWLGDGRLLAITHSTGARPAKLCALKPDGSVEDLAEVPGYSSRASLSRDERVLSLAYIASPKGAASASIVDVDLRTKKATTRQVTVLPAVQPGPLAADETLVVRDRLGALSWTAARLRWLTWEADLGSYAWASPDRRWAVVTARVAQGGNQERLVAVSLADGKFHSVAREAMRVMALRGGGRTFLASVQGSTDSFPPMKGAALMQVYVDWQRVATSGSLRPVKPDRPSAVPMGGSGRGSGAEGGPADTVQPGGS
jgi:hypothetical protein